VEFSARRSRRVLARAREILEHRLTSLAGDLLSVRQLRAECCVQAWRLGESGADSTAEQLFEQIVADYPWFVAAGAQLAHLHLDRGDHAAALRCLRQAQRISPTHPQLMDVRARLMS
jgi:hypothetical protein